MRKYIKYSVFLWVLFASGLTSCSFLDIDTPDNLVKDDYWKTKEQVYASLMGVYTSLHNNLATFIKWGDLRSDLYDYGPKAGDAEKEFIRQDISTGNGLNNWSEAYKGINWTNSFLANARSTMNYDPSISEAEMAAMESEVYAIRALYYFYLVRTFREVPIILDPYESDTQTSYAAPSSETNVLDTIEADLKRAYAHAPESYSTPNEQYGRITKNAVRAIWADVKLWKGDYDGCIQLCEALEPDYDNKMVIGNEWFTMFSEGNSPESIFEYQYLNKGLGSPLYTLYKSGTDNVFLVNYFAYNESILQVFPKQFDNYMYGDTVRCMEVTVSPMNNEALKYIASKPLLPLEYRSEENRNANFIFYRYREVLLMKAEALGMKKDYQNAIATINKIRKASQVPEVKEYTEYGEGEEFFSNLICERVAELAYEGKQWFTLVRLARHTGFSDLLVERIAQHTLYAPLQTMRARLLDPESWFLPYFRTEVEKNPLLEQKPYYDGK